MRAFLFIPIIAFCFSCNNKHSSLKKYYFDNVELHKALADSLSNFILLHKTEVILRKRVDLGNKIILRYYIPETSTRTPIEYDSLLNRYDPYSSQTSEIDIPIDIIKMFKKLNYSSLIADTNGVFFASSHDWTGNQHIGVFIQRSLVDNGSKAALQLAKNVYITKNIIP